VIEHGPMAVRHAKLPLTIGGMNSGRDAFMLKRTIAVAALAAVLGVAFLLPALAAKHAKSTTKMTGACAQPSGRCISDNHFSGVTH